MALQLKASMILPSTLNTRSSTIAIRRSHTLKAAYRSIGTTMVPDPIRKGHIYHPSLHLIQEDYLRGLGRLEVVLDRSINHPRAELQNGNRC